MPLFPTTDVVAWLPEFLRPLFETTGGTASGFDMPAAPDPAFSPDCPASLPQLQRGGQPCPDDPLYSCVRFLIEGIIDKRYCSRLIVCTNLRPNSRRSPTPCRH